MRSNHLAEMVGRPAEEWAALQLRLAGLAAGNEQAGAPTPDTLALLREFGVFRAVLPVEAGGWGVGLSQRRPLGLWTINRRLGFADASIAHCLQVHNNALDLIF